MTPPSPTFARQMAHLAGRLRQGLPGVPALLSMAPPGRGHVPIEAARANGCREAAVLALLYPRRGAAHIVLTLRRADLPDHGGQVSLPGGRCAPTESSLACALREAAEELAVPTRHVEVLGPLTPLYIAPSGHCVQAYLAMVPLRPLFRADKTEVAQVIEVPMAHLLGPAHRGRAERSVRGEVGAVPCFIFGGHHVWGATAMMLAELAALWSDVVRMEAVDERT